MSQVNTEGRLVVASFQAPFGPPLAEVEKVEVTLTVDSGVEDAEVRQRDGLTGLRRGRILRLTEEALAQGGVLTQEDLARALGVEPWTIRRDIQALKSAGHLIPTRGQVTGEGKRVNTYNAINAIHSSSLSGVRLSEHISSEDLFDGGGLWIVSYRQKCRRVYCETV